MGAAASGGGTLPFWAGAGTYGIMPETSGGVALISAYQPYSNNEKTFQWHWGASLAANAYKNPLVPGSSDCHLFIDEMYAGVRWKKLELDLGQKHRTSDFMASDPVLGSLSTTGGHVAESPNARSLPGYLISLEPVSLFKGFVSIYGAFGDFKPFDKRYTADPLIHRTRLGLNVYPTKRLSFRLEMDHYAVWGGNVPWGGKQNVNFSNYLRMVFMRPAGSDGLQMDQDNVIGDQGGAVLLRADYQGNGWHLAFQHDIPYNDGSGLFFMNFPDGINTFSFSFDDKNRWVSDILYEYTYTMYQSGPINIEQGIEGIDPEDYSTKGVDDYFNNGAYRTGWTYYGRVFSSPLFFPTGTQNGSWTSATMTLGVENNRIKAHHFAVSGRLFKSHPYRLLLTFSKNYGIYSRPYTGESQYMKKWGTVKETPLHQFSAAFNGLVRLPVKGLSAMYGVYFDSGEVLRNNLGVSLGVKYNIL